MEYVIILRDMIRVSCTGLTIDTANIITISIEEKDMFLERGIRSSFNRRHLIRY
jgi:hypothetical protein